MNNLFSKASLSTNPLIDENNTNCLKDENNSNAILRKTFSIKWPGVSRPDGKPANSSEEKSLKKDFILGYAGGGFSDFWGAWNDPRLYNVTLSRKPYESSPYEERLVTRTFLEHEHPSIERSAEYGIDHFAYINEVKTLVTSKNMD